MILSLRKILFQSDGGQTVVVMVQSWVRKVIGIVALFELLDNPLGQLDCLVLVFV